MHSDDFEDFALEGRILLLEGRILVLEGRILVLEVSILVPWTIGGIYGVDDLNLPNS